MGIRRYKPTTAGRRGASVSDFAEITRDHPEKSLIRPLHIIEERRRAHFWEGVLDRITHLQAGKLIWNAYKAGDPAEWPCDEIHQYHVNRSVVADMLAGELS